MIAAVGLLIPAAQAETLAEERLAKAPPVLELVRTIDTKPFAGSTRGVKDSESLTYRPQDETFWIGDDDGNAVHQFARADGHFIMKVTAADLVASFPAAGRCTNGTATPCSYTNELETLACGRTNGTRHGPAAVSVSWTTFEGSLATWFTG